MSAPSEVDENQPLLGNSKKLVPKSIVLIFVGLALAVFVASLDETIVATAAVSIVSQYKAFHLYSWISVSYLVCLNAAQPLYGKLSTVFGRRPAVLFGLTVFLAGSVGCAWAPNIQLFLVSRCAAGVGAGGMTNMAFIIVSDIFPLKERPKYQSILMSSFGAANVCGPVLGGVITKMLGWRWCFIINIPICLVTFLAVGTFLRLPRPEGQLNASLRHVDFAGAFTLVASVVGFMIPMTLGGNYFAWNSPAIYAMLSTAVISLVAFFLIEKYVAVDPIVPLRLLKNRSLVGAWLTLFFYGMVFFSMMYYLPVWFEVVDGNTPELIGLQLLPLLVGMVLIGIFLSPLINAAARFKVVAPTCILLYSGCFIMISGVILRTTVTRLTPKILGSFYLLLLGIGGGLVAQTGFLLAQASVSSEDCAVANALAVFWETLGGSFGLSISGTINRIELTKRFSKIPSTLINPETLASINRNPRLVHTPGILGEYTREVVINEFVGSLLLTFRVCVVFAGVIFLTGLLVKHEGLDDAEDRSE